MKCKNSIALHFLNLTILNNRGPFNKIAIENCCDYLSISLSSEYFLSFHFLNCNKRNLGKGRDKTSHLYLVNPYRTFHD